MAVKPELMAVEEEEYRSSVTPEYERDYRWMLARVDELTERYPDQWIAVVGEQVVAAGKDGGAVCREARAKTGRYSFPMDLMQTGSWPARWPR